MRDRRLDFWRGLCLVDMVLVHLVYEGVQFGPLLQATIGEFTRFAAGGFVFVAGMGVGIVFLPRALEAAGRSRAYAALWRRAAYILGVHYASAASFLALNLARGLREPTQSPAALILDILLLREAPPYGDILPLYVMLLAMAPLLLEALRRGLAPLVALASVGVFALGQQQPWLLSPRVGEMFPVVLWQGFFVAGLLFGALLPHFDRLRASLRFAITVLVSVACVAVTASAYAYLRGLESLLPLAFVKVPLSGGELLRYVLATLVVILVTALAGRRLPDTRFGRFVTSLGERSLAVYVAHVWLLAAIAPVTARLGWIGTGQALFALVALGALWAVARTLRDPVLPRVLAAPELRTWLRGWAAPPAGLAAAASLVLVVTAFLPAPEAIESAAVDLQTLEGVGEIELVDATRLEAPPLPEPDLPLDPGSSEAEPLVPAIEPALDSPADGLPPAPDHLLA
jgi:hypothetical protein